MELCRSFVTDSQGFIMMSHKRPVITATAAKVLLFGAFRQQTMRILTKKKTTLDVMNKLNGGGNSGARIDVVVIAKMQDYNHKNTSFSNKVK